MASFIDWKVKVKSLSRVWFFATPWSVAHQTPPLLPWHFPGKNTGVGCHFLLQGIFLTQGLNPDLRHCRQTLYSLSHQGSSLTSRVHLDNSFTFSVSVFSLLKAMMMATTMWVTVGLNENKAFSTGSVAKRSRQHGKVPGESNMEIYITMCKIDGQWEFALWLREFTQGLCDKLEEWDWEGDGREVQERGTYVYLWLIHVDILQKTAEFCKAIILQLKLKKKATAGHMVPQLLFPQCLHSEECSGDIENRILFFLISWGHHFFRILSATLIKNVLYPGFTPREVKHTHISQL